MALPADLQEWIDVMRRGARDPARDVLIAWLPRLRGMARKHLLADSPLRVGFDAGDLAQEGLLQLLRSVETFRGSSWPEFLAFVHAALAQQQLQQVRRHEVRARESVSHASAEEQPGPSSTAGVDTMAAEDRRRVRALVENLPEPYRTTMVLRLQGLDNDALVARPGVTAEALRQRLSRAVRLLQERW